MKSEKQHQEVQITTGSADETIQLGRRIGAVLRGGEIIAFTGQLGTGKTHLIKGIAAGAGAVDAKEVTSPTFVLVNEYTCPECSLEVYHIDAYRLESVAEFEGLGFDDLCHPASVVLIEWADKIQPALANIDRIDIQMSHIGETERQIIIKNFPAYLSNILNL